MKTLSKMRSKKREEFNQLESFIEEKIWTSAQKFKSNIYTCNKSVYVFPNQKYFERDIKNITKVLLKKHIESFRAKSFSDFAEQRVFWLYDNETGTCQCKTFWKLGRCKRKLAVLIHLKEIKVNFFNFYFYFNRFLISFQQRK